MDRVAGSDGSKIVVVGVKRIVNALGSWENPERG